MSRLSSHTNVYNTCLRLIREKGYNINLEGDTDEDDIIIPDSLIWIAEKGEYDFLAHNPIELLGLVCIHEKIQPEKDEPYWWSVDGEDIYSELMDKAFL